MSGQSCPIAAFAGADSLQAIADRSNEDWLIDTVLAHRIGQVGKLFRVKVLARVVSPIEILDLNEAWDAARRFYAVRNFHR